MKQKNLIKDFLNAILNARKMVRLYPDNNPIYSKAMDTLVEKAANAFEHSGEIVLQVEPQALIAHDEKVYQSREQHDNFAFLFFQEGLRELTFKKDVQREELEEFLKIISLDDKELAEQDLVSLLWDRDFQNIKYVVDEGVFSVDDDYESIAMQKLLKHPTSQDKIMAAYKDACTAEDVKTFQVESPSESDFDDLRIQFDRDSEIKMYKIINIIFELYYAVRNRTEMNVITSIMKALIEYLIHNDDIESLVDILKKINMTMNDEALPEGIRESLNEVVCYAGSPDIVKAIGSLMDSSDIIDEDILREFATYLDKSAIQSFVDLLGELQNYSTRQMVINILSELGRKDLKVLLTGLTDNRWYLVRNIVVIINQIGDKRTASQLIKTAKHPDVRVKTEVIKTMGELKVSQAILMLEQNLNAEEPQIRISAVKALGQIHAVNAKRILMQHIKENRTFVNKDYDEKKCFFEALCLWKENDVAEFIASFLRKRPYFNRKKHYENMACAANALSKIGTSEYLPLLKKYEQSGDPLLKGQIQNAIRSIASRV